VARKPRFGYDSSACSLAIGLIVKWEKFGKKDWPHRGNIHVFVQRDDEEPQEDSKAGVVAKS
jgi:hypothetical protein